MCYLVFARVRMHTCPILALDVLLLFTLQILQSQQHIPREAEVFGDRLPKASNAPSLPPGIIHQFSSKSMPVDISEDFQFANPPQLTRSILASDDFLSRPLSQWSNEAGVSRDHNSGHGPFPARISDEISFGRVRQCSGQQRHRFPQSSSWKHMETEGKNLRLQREGSHERSNFSSLYNPPTIYSFVDRSERVNSLGLSSSPIDWPISSTHRGDPYDDPDAHTNDAPESEDSCKSGESWELGSIVAKSGYLTFSTKPASGLKCRDRQSHRCEISAAAHYLPIHLRSQSASVRDFSGMDCLSEVFDSGMPESMKLHTAPSGKKNSENSVKSVPIRNSFSKSLHESRTRQKITNIFKGAEAWASGASDNASNEILEKESITNKSHVNPSADASLQNVNDVSTSCGTFQPKFFADTKAPESQNQESQQKHMVDNHMFYQEQQRQKVVGGLKDMGQAFSLVDILHREVGSQQDLDLIAQEIGLSHCGIEESEDDLDEASTIMNPSLNTMKVMRKKEQVVPLSPDRRANVELRELSFCSRELAEKTNNIPCILPEKIPGDPAKFKFEGEGNVKNDNYNKSMSNNGSALMGLSWPETPSEQMEVCSEYNRTSSGKEANCFSGKLNNKERKIYCEAHESIIVPILKKPQLFQTNANLKKESLVERQLGFIPQKLVEPAEASTGQNNLSKTSISVDREMNHPQETVLPSSLKDEMISNFFIEIDGILDFPKCKVKSKPSKNVESSGNSTEPTYYKHANQGEPNKESLLNKKRSDQNSEDKKVYAIADLVKTRARKNGDSKLEALTGKKEEGIFSKVMACDASEALSHCNYKPKSDLSNPKILEKKKKRKEVYLDDVYQRTKSTAKKLQRS